MRRLLFILFHEPTNNTMIQLFRYGFVGGAAFLIDYGLLFSLTEWLEINYLVSAAIAFVVGLVVNYLLSISWVFNQNRNGKPMKEFLFFTVIGVVGLMLNELILYAVTDWMHLHYMFSKIISTVIVFFWNFFARKTLLFNK